jgi:fructose-1,6-bisphosphatase/sedoheptulose 1,7-bisphosphatase-like protein
MRSTADGVTVRLYHLSDGDEGGAAQTLMYGSLSDAMAMAGQQPEEVQAGLFIATDNDVIAYLELIEE